MFSTQITIRNIPSSAALESIIQKKAEKLKQFYDRIVSCKVVLEMPQKHKRQGKLYNLRIDMLVPGKLLVTTRKNNQDVYVVIRDAFNALARQLEEHAKKRHGRVKTHNGVLHGHIARMVPNEGYGFIEGTDGNEYYFSMTNVSYPKFNQLLIGDAVEYLPQACNDGWHAHHVVRERHNNHLAA